MRTHVITLAAWLALAGCAASSGPTTQPGSTPAASSSQQPAGLAAANPDPQADSQPAATASAPALRTIFANGKAYKEESTGKFNSWRCVAYTGAGLPVELGYFDNPKMDGVGFVLYDGGDSGETTKYQRSGINERWDWGWNEARGAYLYAFIIKPSGMGLYYDFTTALNGPKDNPDDVYDCRKK
jgi:hypothetical protein